MDKELLHGIGIILPQEIDSKIKAVHEKITEKFTDQYIYMGEGGVWKAHLIIFSIALPDTKTSEMIRQTENIIREIKPFTLTLGEYITNSDKKYIFLELDPGSADLMVKLHDKFMNALLPLRTKQIPDRFVEKWDTFSPEQQDLIVQTGNIYPYHPHFSLSKMTPEETKAALDLIKDSSLKGTGFTVNQFYLSKESATGVNEYPTINTFKLG